MKKHLMRVLTVLLMACLGIGILTACGGGTDPKDPDNPENPVATDPIEGVWSGATATGLFGSSTATDTFTATVDLVEGQAHAGYVVVKATEGEADYYFAFGIDKDGENYKGSMSIGPNPIEITVSLADNKLTAVIPFGEDPTPLVFTSREASFPAAISPTGTLYAEVNSHVTYKIDFTAKKLYSKTESGSYTDQNVKFINVGDYIGIEPTAEGTEGAGLVPVFKSGSDYYIFVLAASEEPIKLTATEPTPPSPPTPTPETYTVTYALGDHAANDATVPQQATATETNQYKVTLPEAPEAATGYEFAGWQIGDDEENVMEAEDEITVTESITVTAIWVRAYTQDENVQAQILAWFTAGTLTRTVEDGTEVTLEVTVTGGINAVYAGLLTDVNMNDDWYRLRMDTAVFTLSGNSWDTHVDAIDQWSASYTSGNIDNYNGMQSAVIIAVASLENNVLTYTVSVYATTDTEYTTPIVVTKHIVTSTTDVAELALNFYYDPAGNNNFAVSSATVNYPTPIPATYTVTYELGDHAGPNAEVPDAETATVDNQYKVTLPEAPEAEEGWEFAGWQIGDDVDNVVEAGEEITVTADITVTATWSEVVEPTTPADGVWTFEEDGVTTEITIKLSTDKETAEVIILTADLSMPTFPTYAINYYTLEKTDTGYTYTTQVFSTVTTTTFTWWNNGTFTRTVSRKTGTTDLGTETTTFSANTSLPANAPAFTEGEYVADAGWTSVIVNFDDDTVTADRDTYDLTTKTLGKYLIVIAEEYDDILEESTYYYYFVYEDADVYYLLGGDIDEPTEFEEQIRAEYTVTFNLTDKSAASHAAAGATAPAPIIGKDGDPIDLPKDVETEDGYEVIAWREWTDANNYTDHSVSSKFTVRADVTLYAVYGPIEYRLTFDKNKPADATAEPGGMIPPMLTVSLEEPTVTLPELTLDGYTFLGWKKDNAGDAVTSFTLTADVIAALTGKEISFTAAWQKVEAGQFSVTFNRGTLDDHLVNTLQGMPANTSVAAGEYTIPAQEPTCDGYTFVGWKVSGATGDTVYKSGTANDKYTVSGAVTFVAQWEKVKYTVTYNYGEGTDDTKASEQVAWGEDVNFPATPNAKEGYTFDGWEAMMDGDDEVLGGHSANSFTMPRGNVTVYAQWTHNTPAPTVDINGVWTNSDGWSVTVQLDDESGAAVVIDDDGTYDYYMVYASESGTGYDGMSASGETAHFDINATGQLVMTIDSGDPVTLATHGTLGDALELSGTYTCSVDMGGGSSTPVTVNFDTLKVTIEGEQTFTAAYVGGYIVLVIGEYPNSQCLYIYENDSKYYLAGFGAPVELTKQQDTPPTPAVKIDGVWSGVTIDMDPGSATYTATLVLIDNSQAHFILAAVMTIPNGPTQTTYLYYLLTKAQDGSYIGTTTFLAPSSDVPTKQTITVSLNAENQLSVVIASETEHPTPVVFPTRVDLPQEGLQLTGSYYGEFEDQVVEINFDDQSLKINFKPSSEIGMTVTFIPVANFIVLKCEQIAEATDEEADATTLYGIVYENNGKYYLNGLFGLVSNVELSTTPIEPEPETYTVTYEPGTHAAEDATATTATATEENEYKVELPDAPAAAKGWKFKGWKVGDDTALKDAKAQIVVSADITITAQWEAITYKVEYAGEGIGTMPQDDTITMESDDFTLPADPTRTGYDFAGWEVTGHDGKFFNKDGLTLAADMIPATGETITLTATWTAKTYEVTLNAGENGTVTGEGKVTATYDDALTLTDATPNKGYIFDGWYTDEDAGTKVESGSTWTTDDENVTLYAHYNYMEYTVEFAEGDKGTGTVTLPTAPQDKISLESGHNTITLTAPTYDGTDKVFAGWELNGYSIQAGEYSLIADHLPDNPADPAEAKLTFIAKWSDAGKVLVSYELGQHAATDASAPGSEQVDENGTVTLPAAPAAETGYEFDGWYVKLTDEANSTEKVGETYQVSTSAITFIAKFKATEYTVVFAKGGDNDVEGDQIANGTVTIETARNTIDLTDKTGYSRAGYTLAGWELNGQTYTDTFTLTADIITALDGETTITLTAQWNKVTYTVTYVYGEGAEETKDAEDIAWGETVTLVPPTAKEGYEFGGWQVKETAGESTVSVSEDEGTYTFTMPQYNVTVTAQWNKTEYTVTYDYGTGTDAKPEQATAQVVWGNVVTLPAAPAAKDGYEFGGWEVKETAGESTVSVSEDEGTYTFTMPQYNVTVTATWTPKTYTVTLVAGDNGTLAEGNDTVEATYNAALDLTGKDPTPNAGYTFKGWFTEATAGTQFTSGDLWTTTDEGKLTLYAQYDPKTYNVTLVAGTNGKFAEEKDTDTVQATYNVELDLTDKKPTPNAGYTFKGWSFDEKGDNEFISGSKWTTDGEDLKLYAQWTRKTPQITLELGDSESEIDTPTAVWKEESNSYEITLPTDKPELAHYHFDGWDVTGGTLGSDDSANIITVPLADEMNVTITAKWTKEYTLKFYNGDGEETVDHEITVLEGTNVMEDDEFERVNAPTVETNYYFDGWYYEKDGQQYLLGTGIKPEDMIADGGNEIKLHAKISMRFSTEGYTLDQPLYIHEGGLQKGSAITFSGDLTFTKGTTTLVHEGILGYLSQGAGYTNNYIVARYDYCFNNSSATAGDSAQTSMPELNWTLNKTVVAFSNLIIGDWFAAYSALIQRANVTFKFELEYDYTTEGVVFISYVITNPTEFTYTYGEGSTQSQAVPANSDFIMRYAIMASDGGNLDNLVVAIGGEQATLANVQISEVKNSHIHTGDDTCDICGKKLTKSDVQNLTLTNHNGSGWAAHIAEQTTGEYTAAPGKDLHVKGEFGTVGDGWNGFAIIIAEKTSQNGLFCQYSSGSVRTVNSWTLVDPWNIDKRIVNGQHVVTGDGTDTLSSTIKSDHKFELILTYDGERAKLTIITYQDDWQTAADTRVVTYNIKGSEMQLAIGLDGDGTTTNVKNVQYYTITAQDAAE